MGTKLTFSSFSGVVGRRPLSRELRVVVDGAQETSAVPVLGSAGVREREGLSVEATTHCGSGRESGPRPGSGTNRVFLSQPSSASGRGKQVPGACPSLWKAPVRLRSPSTTIKTDPAVCLILPKSLVCIQEPAGDTVFVWGWFGCQGQKPIEPAHGQEDFLSAGTRNAS